MQYTPTASRKAREKERQEAMERWQEMRDLAWLGIGPLAQKFESVARYAEVTPPEIKSDIKFGAASQENNAWLRISQRRAP